MKLEKKTRILQKNRSKCSRILSQLMITSSIISSILKNTQEVLADELEAHIEIGSIYNASEDAWGGYMHSTFIFMGEHKGGHVGFGPGIGFHAGNQLPSATFEIVKPQSLLIHEGHIDIGIEFSYGFKPTQSIIIAPFFEIAAGAGMLWHGSGTVGYKKNGVKLFAEATEQFFPLATTRLGLALQYKNFGIVLSAAAETPFIEIKDGINGPELKPKPSINIDAIGLAGIFIELENH